MANCLTKCVEIFDYLKFSTLLTPFPFSALEFECILISSVITTCLEIVALS